MRKAVVAMIVVAALLLIGFTAGGQAAASGVWCTFDAFEADIVKQDEDEIVMVVTVHGFGCDLP